MRGPVCSAFALSGWDGSRTEEEERGEERLNTSGSLSRVGLNCGIRGDDTSEDI